MIEWSNVFSDALPYAPFLEQYASPAHRPRWDAMRGRFSLTAEQRGLLGGFARRMPVLCLAGAWCGDCINQCPIHEHFAADSKYGLVLSLQDDGFDAASLDASLTDDAG